MNNDLYKILNGQINKQELPANLNPEIRRETNIYLNKNPLQPTNPSSQGYNWVWKYVQTDLGIQYPRLTPDLLNSSEKLVNSQIITSSDGNLSKLGLQGKTVHLFIANVYTRLQKNTIFNFGWNDSLLLNINNQFIASNLNGTAFNSKYTPITLRGGWNRIEIYIYSQNNDNTFTINNNKFGELIDSWGTVTDSLVSSPVNMSISTEVNLINKKDPNTNILNWIPPKSSSINGYNVYRRGPYNSGITSPSINQFSSSGYIVSGLNIVGDVYRRFTPVYYTVTATDLNGESNYVSDSFVDPGSPCVGILSMSGLQVTTLGAALGSGVYSYTALAKTWDGRYVPNQVNLNFVIVNNSNSIKLDWSNLSGIPGIDSYDIFRLNTITTSNLDSSFSGYLLANTSVNTSAYLDTGVIGTLYNSGFNLVHNSNEAFPDEPPVYYANNSSYVNWSGVQGSGQVTYNIYRTFYSGNYQNSTNVGMTTGLFIVDNNSVSVTNGQNSPPIYKEIASLNYGNTTYKDIGVIANRTYDYKITAYNQSLVESAPTFSSSILAGKQTSPNAPSGVSVTYSNGFADLIWQDGVEPDLVGTIIYQSGFGPVNGYTEVGRTEGSNYQLFAGTSGIIAYRLANYNTSDINSIQTTEVFLNIDSYLASNGPYVLRSGDLMYGDLTIQARLNVGTTNTLSGINSVVFGSNNLAAGDNSLAIGEWNQAIGEGSIAANNFNTTYGLYSRANGEFNTTYSQATSADGSSNSVSGYASKVQGYRSATSGAVAFAAGTLAFAVHNNSMVLSDEFGATSTSADQLMFSFMSGVALTSGTHILPISGVNNLGSPSQYFNNLYVNNLVALSGAFGSSIVNSGDFVLRVGGYPGGQMSGPLYVDEIGTNNSGILNISGNNITLTSTGVVTVNSNLNVSGYTLTVSTLVGTSGITTRSNIIPQNSGTLDLGSTTKYFNNLYVKQINNSATRSIAWNEIPAGITNGINKVFTVGNYIYDARAIQLFINGIYLTPSGIGAPYFDFLINNDTITTLSAPVSGSIIIANYQY